MGESTVAALECKVAVMKMVFVVTMSTVPEKSQCDTFNKKQTCCLLFVFVLLVFVFIVKGI